MKMWTGASALLGLLPSLVQSLAPTDSIRDADLAGSGYLPNHNMDPTIVNSTSFGILWTNSYDKLEKFYTRPLVYTTAGINNGAQFVFLASTKNVIRTVDGKTGKAILSRTLIPPFLQSDIGCTDIPNYIGVVGTPVIDPATDTVFFFAKGYRNGAAGGGVVNGVYQFYAVGLADLADRPGFPVLIDGHNADNDPTRYFVGGTVLQRPALVMVNNVVYGGFGGHCDKYNYTGLIVGVSTQPGVGVVSMYAMEVSPFAPPVTTDVNEEVGGKAGIWMGGMAIATDGARLFFSTGNGRGHQNQDNPASGRLPLATLDECVVNLAIGPNNKLSLADYFEPYEYRSMDAADRDLGSAGVLLLDPGTFNGAGVQKMAVVVGKNGKVYIMNADNLGGYMNGPARGDAVLQTITASGAIFGGPGSYPLEGGYLYFTPVGGPTVAYKFGRDGGGNPLFSQVGSTWRSYGANPGIANSAGRVGPGIPTITTFKGQAGTALMWRTDPDAGLQVFSAVPNAAGHLEQINIPGTGGLNKFLRPAFGDTRLYVSDNNGNVICLGSPVAIPLVCDAPVDFGNVNIGSSKTLTVRCTAQININSLAGLKVSDPTFIATNASLPTGPLATGQTFTFPVTWNLNGTTNQNAQNASFGAVSPGIKTGVVTLFTNNAIAGFTTSYPISLTGNQVSSTPFLKISPTELDFAGLVLGSASSAAGVPDNFIITNAGATPMTITGYAYTTDLAAEEADAPPVDFTNTTQSGNGTQIGTNFFSKDLPPVNTVLQAGESVTVSALFTASEVGQYLSIFQVWSDGGIQNILLSGGASTAPQGELSIETAEGGWDPNPVMDFGIVTSGTVARRRIRICNSGGSALQVTKSKPPIQLELKAENPSGDLHEGQSIPVDSCAYGAVLIAATAQQADVADHTVADEWVLNTDDINFGVKDVKITAVIRSIQVGPQGSNGTALYRNLACYLDNRSRQLEKQFNSANNSNGYCIDLCYSKGYTFAGTEYHTECWCGNKAPNVTYWNDPALKQCAFTCPGDTNQICGGDIGLINVFYDTSKYTPNCDAIPCASTSSSASSSASSTPSTTPTPSANSTSSNPTVTPSSNSTVTPPANSTSSQPSLTPPANSTTGPTATTNTTSTPPSATPSSTSTATSKWTSLGCWHDPNTPPITKSLYPNLQTANDSMTIELCQAVCEQTKYQYAGLEYGRECYCGNTIVTSATPGWTGCTMKCAANASETCGGPNAMNVYNLTAPSVTPSGTPSSSPTPSASSTSASSSVTPSASSNSTTPPSVTATPTPSNSSTPASNSATPTPSSRSSSSSSPSLPSGAQFLTPTLGYAQYGCYAEPPNGRAFNQLIAASDQMGVEGCISAASAALPATTYGYIGVEYGRECWAAVTAPPIPTSYVGAKACSMACKGNASESCGGPAMFNMYVTTASTSRFSIVTANTTITTITTGSAVTSARFTGK